MNCRLIAFSCMLGSSRHRRGSFGWRKDTNEAICSIVSYMDTSWILFCSEKCPVFQHFSLEGQGKWCTDPSWRSLEMIVQLLRYTFFHHFTQNSTQNDLTSYWTIVFRWWLPYPLKKFRYVGWDIVSNWLPIEPMTHGEDWAHVDQYLMVFKVLQFRNKSLVSKFCSYETTCKLHRFWLFMTVQIKTLMTLARSATFLSYSFCWDMQQSNLKGFENQSAN